LGLGEHITEYLSFDVMLPAPGQGAMAIQCRADDAATRELLAAIDDPASRVTVTAERAFLQGLGGGCSAPVAAYAHFQSDLRPLTSNLRLTGFVASTDGRRVIHASGEGTDPLSLGAALAQQALDQGAGELLR
jgi:hydroxymethylbilane synthase